jgi:hypothetical protein
MYLTSKIHNISEFHLNLSEKFDKICKYDDNSNISIFHHLKKDFSMSKKGLLVSFLMCVVAVSMFAGGKKDVTDRSLGEKNSWQETFDINEKSSGTYNIVVTATDNAGNQTVAGPFNIKIDTESDLPVAGITNPVQNMRIPGNLNIVGTCVDDDAVDHVNIIFDGDEENMQTAVGKEFWSYYLDTNALKEGPHTIEVFGTDINGLRGHSVKLTWQLDRRAPVTTVTNIGMGTLVSGKINLEGRIQDGNGIESLEYSLDGGQYFSKLRIKDEKLKEPDANGLTEYWTFTVPIDTKKSSDGPAVCWFKAKDNAGSVGVYSFLYFIDNTSPDVKIVSPKNDEVMNGVFSVAGYAKDTIGIQRLSWSFAGQTGDFDLVAGNPYWIKEIDTRKIAGKSVDFSVTAVDTAGNVVTMKRAIKVDQEKDKPVVQIMSPAAAENVEGTDGSLFVRGIVTDDDGVASVSVKVDNGEEISTACQGVFYVAIPGELANGQHTITAYAKDKNDIVGNKTIVTFTAKGVAPSFDSAVIKTGVTTTPFVDGMAINPEADALYQVNVNSSIGLKTVDYEFTWGKDGDEVNTLTLKGGEKKVPINIPLNVAPWGVVKLAIHATDMYDRVSTHYALFNIHNLTRVYTTTPGVYFTDSTVPENGGIVNDPDHPVTGYFVGGKIKKVEFVPTTKAATVTNDGNVIILTPGNGGSDQLVVRVTTDKGATFDSRKLYFIADGEAPSLKLSDDSAETLTPIEMAEAVTIKGTTDASANVVYRILSTTVTLSSGVVTASAVNPIAPLDQATKVTVNKGAFALTFKPDDIPVGISIIEFVASNSSGKNTVRAVAIRKIPDVPAPAEPVTNEDGTVTEPAPLPAPAAPAVYWLQGVDLYPVALYQGYTNVTFNVYKEEDLVVGPNSFRFDVSTSDAAAKPVSSTYTRTKQGGISARIDNISGTPYQSGMLLNIERGAEKEASHKATISIKSNVAINKIQWTVGGETAAGGDARQTGTIDVKGIRAVADGEYEADIPLQNLPSRITDIDATITNASGNIGSVHGTVCIVRTHDETRIDDTGDIYWSVLDGVTFDASHNRYVLNGGASLTAYANLQGPVTATLANAQNGLSATAEGNVVRINATTDGLYKDVVLKVTDAEGVVYTAPAVTLIVDTAKPVVTLNTPQSMGWMQKKLLLSGSATDGNGIATLEFSFDGQQTWNIMTVDKSGAFKSETDLSSQPDGFIPIDIRATDNAGKVTICNSVVQKDTEAPAVEVIIPDAGVVVNGENTIAFKVTDAGVVNTIKYTSGDKKLTTDIALTSLPTTMVGTQEQPIGNDMSFTFTDKAGNVNNISKWDFKVDAASDLPRAEIHLPVENEVITRDFIVSGVIYDDDGPSKIWYKLDNGQYTALPEYGTSFSMDVPLETMTDNEHSITVYAEDIHGVKGPETSRKFRISLEEPKGNVTAPAISETVRGTVTIKGTASDKNGISKVQISVDNGASYNDAVGTADWTYTFDTRVIQDATHVVFVKIWDGYDITGLYSTLINVDNTSPNLNLELPLDDSKTTRNVFFSGQTTDNIGLKELYITVRSLDSGKKIPDSLARTNLVPSEIISQVIDLSQLDNGFYNIELTGTDAAGNITRVSRNIQLDKNKPLTTVDLLYPLNGEHTDGIFNIYGTATSDEEKISSVTLYVDGKILDNVQPTTVTESGYFKFAISPSLNPDVPDALTEGKHTYKVIATTESGKQISSNEQYLIYSKSGPWVTLNNFTYGDFAMNRPLLKGDAGYTLSQEETDALNSKDTSKEKRAAIDAKTIKQVWLSFDNGKSYTAVSKPGKGKWQYRVENEDISAGFHFMLIKAEMENGENAITRMIVQVDHTGPSIKLISPGAGGHYNQQLMFAGLTSDDVALKDVTLTLRKGDKAAYEVPGFIQGLYFDVSFWGATLYNVGVGLTAFENAVKIQGNFGQFTQEQRNAVNDLLGLERDNLRFGGSVVGGKIIAQLAYLPFRYFFGRDWDWLSATFAIGANFSYFTQSGATQTVTNSDGTTTTEPVAQILSALLAQVEFPRITIKNQKYFKTWSIYVEPQVWFIPSDIASKTAKKQVYTISGGVRVNVF